MKTLLLTLLLFCAALSVNSAQWQVLRYYPYYTFTNAAPSETGVAAFPFPNNEDHQWFPAFLVVTQQNAVNLSNATMRCSFRVDATADATFRFGGQGTWNLGPTPPSARLYFSTVNGYDNNQPGTNYWFNGAGVEITNTTGTAALSVMLDTNVGWTDGQGQSDAGAFWSAAGRVKSVGLAFGGGWFYDIGIAMTSGQATFNLLTYDVAAPSIPPPKALRLHPS